MDERNHTPEEIRADRIGAIVLLIGLPALAVLAGFLTDLVMK